MSRFQDENISIYHFQDKIFVECPKCEKRAVVAPSNSQSRFSKRALKCPNCFYYQSGRKEFYAIELNCYCPHCASELNVEMPSVNEKKETILVTCSSCGKTENYSPRNIHKQRKYKSKGKPSENYFGLPLWLSENFKGKNFWAFNYEHLEYLKQYISAEVRVKNRGTYRTMTEKLPYWMKSGKNRDKIVKLITELERK